MMGFGPTELLLVLAIILIIFGAGKLPQVLSSLGKGVKEFREASDGRATEALQPESSQATPEPQNRTAPSNVTATHPTPPTTTA